MDNKILIISPCHYGFGGWFRADNIARELRLLKYRVFFLYPLKAHKLLKRVLNGVINCRYVFGKDIIHIFELVQPECFFPAFLGKILGKKVIVDVGDEWLHTIYPNRLFYLWVGLVDKLLRFFPLTVTSDYLIRKYGKGIKLINGVNYGEFEPVHRNQARKELGINYEAKVLLAFGNTWGNQRTKLLKETYQWVKLYDESIQLYVGMGWNKKKLGLYLSACDLVLFPTGGEPCEQACFPIRVGSCLNAERVIATDTANTEFHSALNDCLLVGDYPKDIALNIVYFFKDKSYRKQLEENTKKKKQELGWNKLIIKLEEFYKNADK